MKFVILALLVAFCLGLTAAANIDVYLIDSFDVESDTLVVVTTGTTTFPATDESFTPDSTIFSGERDSQVTVTAAPSGQVFSSAVNDGEYSCSAPPSGTAFTVLQYDGVDTSMELDPSGALNDPNNDFTSGNAFALHLLLTADQPTTVEAFVYSGSSDNYCSFTFNVPGNSQQTDYVANYNQFTKIGLGCDFTNVGAVELVTDLPPNVDIVVELFATYATAATTPSPAASASKSPQPSKNPCNCVCPGFHCVLEYDPSGVNTFYYQTSDIQTSHQSSGSTVSSGSSGVSTRSSNNNNNSSSDASTLTVAVALVVAVVALLL